MSEWNEDTRKRLKRGLDTDNGVYHHVHPYRGETADIAAALEEIEKLKADLKEAREALEPAFRVSDQQADRAELAEQRIKELETELADEAGKACKYQALSDRQRERIKELEERISNALSILERTPFFGGVNRVLRAALSSEGEGE